MPELGFGDLSLHSFECFTTLSEPVSHTVLLCQHPDLLQIIGKVWHEFGKIFNHAAKSLDTTDSRWYHVEDHCNLA